MITEIVLVAIIIILSALLGWKEREARLERNKLINAILAKNAQEMVSLDLADKTEIKAEVPKKPELIPLEDLTNDEFKEAVL